MDVRRTPAGCVPGKAHIKYRTCTGPEMAENKSETVVGVKRDNDAPALHNDIPPRYEPLDQQPYDRDFGLRLATPGPETHGIKDIYFVQTGSANGVNYQLCQYFVLKLRLVQPSHFAGCETDENRSCIVIHAVTSYRDLPADLVILHVIYLASCSADQGKRILLYLIAKDINFA